MLSNDRNNRDRNKDRSKTEERIRKLFNQLDTRNEGKLTDIEALRAGLKEINHPLGGARTLLQDVFEHIDSGNDGVISQTEFRDFVLETEDKLRRLFRKIDTFDQGKLERAEIHAALRKAGVTQSDERLNEFFAAMDYNLDGYITFEEWRDFLLFMPEKAPDFTMRNVLLYFQSIHQVTSEGDILISDDSLQSMGYFLAGGIAGAVSRTATAPFDRLKVALIASTESPLLGVAKEAVGALNSLRRVRNSPITKALQTIHKEGGAKSFFVGNGLNVIKIFPESAIKFGSYEAAKKLIAGSAGTEELSSASRFLAGGIAGAVSQISVYPIDTLKFRVQCESGGTESGSAIMNTAKRMWSHQGIRSFYRGLPLGVLGIIPYSSIDLGTFELLKRYYIAQQADVLDLDASEVEVPNFLVLAFGATSGSIGASLVYPLNLLRTRLQAQGTRAHPATYDGFMDVTRKTITKEGWRGLFRGLVPNLMKVIPSVSISYLVWCFASLRC